MGRGVSVIERFVIVSSFVCYLASIGQPCSIVGEVILRLKIVCFLVLLQQ